jgi:DNA topoisomerase-1
MSDELLAYCVKCKEKRPISEAEPVFTKAAQPATRGVCPVCGTNLYRMGETPAHEGMERPEPPSRPSSKKGDGPRKGRLVIVESPAKARTIENYLGKDYRVKASVGHVRDLLKSKLSVDIENDFEPRYRVPNNKRDVVKELRAAAAKAEEVYIATDPDREGEAIAWHLMDAAEIERERARRVVFHEITKDAVRRAFENPRGIDMNLVDAQQARRILDRLVGYKLSPLLWEKVRPRLSAGRVQSVAVRMIVERERDIERFVPDEYWSIEAELAREAERSDPERISFCAKLLRIHDEKVDLPSEEAVKPVLADLEGAAYVVDEVTRGTRRRNPSAPFTTSTMQQEASRRLGFTARKTMSVAQGLYEGVQINGSMVGLITYMRTDSLNISDDAKAQAATYIRDEYGAEYLPDEPNEYVTTTKGAQEAHEAIRPTGVDRTPDALESVLSKDQYALYTLIWQRFVASQMAPAEYDTIRIDVLAGPPGSSNGDKPYRLRASGSTLRFPGFLAVYADFEDEDNPVDEDLGRIFPDVVNGDPLDLLGLFPEQHFTQPPPRYSEATLVKALEEYGIGRPSTYAPILNTIQQRGYVRRESKRLYPTETGEIVNDLLVKYFSEIVDVNFTASMEEDLDEIASGEQDWVPVLRDFYEPFERELEHARAHAPDIDLDEEIGRECPKCGNPLVIRWGRYGKFIGCSNFPECRYTEPWLEKIGVACPECGGDIVERHTRRGRTFYGCSNYPECEWTSWKRPLRTPCPVCGGLMVAQNNTWAQCLNCEEQVRLDELPEGNGEPEGEVEGM